MAADQYRVSNFSLYSPEEQQAILNKPLLAAPPGVIPDFDNHPNKNGRVLAVVVFYQLKDVPEMLYVRTSHHYHLQLDRRRCCRACANVL